MSVLQAVRAGIFHVYAVSCVDEALALLAGEPAGALDDQGKFAEGSVNARVVERLREISQMGMDDEDKPLAVEEKAAPAARKPARKKTPPATGGS